MAAEGQSADKVVTDSSLKHIPLLEDPHDHLTYKNIHNTCIKDKS